jgi:hypothetical protein
MRLKQNAGAICLVIPKHSLLCTGDPRGFKKKKNKFAENSSQLLFTNLQTRSVESETLHRMSTVEFNSTVHVTVESLFTIPARSGPVQN